MSDLPPKQAERGHGNENIWTTDSSVQPAGESMSNNQWITEFISKAGASSQQITSLKREEIAKVDTLCKEGQLPKLMCGNFEKEIVHEAAMHLAADLYGGDSKHISNRSTHNRNAVESFAHSVAGRDPKTIERELNKSFQDRKFTGGFVGRESTYRAQVKDGELSVYEEKNVVKIEERHPHLVGRAKI